MDTKVCKNEECDLAGVEQPLDNFYFNKSGKGGRMAQCKTCTLLERKFKAADVRKPRGPIPCAGVGLIRQALDHELSKISEDNIASARKEAYEFDRFKCRWFINWYKTERLLAIEKIKALL